MAKLVWTDKALRWLDDMFEYVAQDNPDAAARTVQGIYDRAQALVHHPEMGERYAGLGAPRSNSPLRPLPNRLPRKA